MQPEDNQNPSQWRQPNEQAPQSPYVAPEPMRSATGPVVTLTPDEVLTPIPSGSIAGDNSAVVAIQPDVDPAMAPVRWQATEYIHREKSPVWFVIFAFVTVALIAFAALIIKSITFAILIPVMAAALLMYGYRPPRVIDYTLSRKGLHVNDHLYPFGDFKSFGVIHDDEEYSVFLVPVRRFRPGVTVYFPEEAGEEIVDMLAARLPMKELHLDIVDRLIRKLRL